MRETIFATESDPAARVSGHQLTADGPVPVEPLAVPAFGPAGTSMLATASDMLRFAALHLDYPALAVLRRPQSAARIHGWLDDWCLGWALFDWQGGRVWGWDSVLNGERAVLRLVPDHRAAVVLMTNGSTGRALYRSLFPDLMQTLFGIGVPPLRLDAETWRGRRPRTLRRNLRLARPTRRARAKDASLLIREQRPRRRGATARRADLPRRLERPGQP